jgi:serine/threonine protein kinase
MNVWPDLGNLAPEYALDEVLVTASDMYSLGCLIYAVHCNGHPPFQNHGSLGGLRENAGRPPPNMERWDSDLQGDSHRLLFSDSLFSQLCSFVTIVDHTTRE